jgi:ATP-dependent DNA helicase RecG
MNNSFKKKLPIDIQYLSGIGPKRAEILKSEGISSPKDLLLYFPKNYVSRNSASSLKALAVKLHAEESSLFNEKRPGAVFRNETTVIAKLKEIKEYKYGQNRIMVKYVVSDTSGGTADVLFWNYATYYLNAYKINELLTISGKPELDDFGRIQFHHPEIERFSEEDERDYSEGSILPVYRISPKMKTAHFTTKQLRKIIKTLIESELETLEESLPVHLLAKYHYPPQKEAVLSLHFPVSFDAVESARKRIKFEEIFYYELALALQRQGVKSNERAYPMIERSKLARQLYDSLPFKLTGDQKKALREIGDDMAKQEPMNRLLQGDVGSGKTIVALLSILMAIDNGCQTAFLAPTELLAEQHYHSLKRYLEGFPVNIIQLVGGQKKKVRNAALESIESGEANIIVGTHALFESEIQYNRLGLIIIDEQHRFGVEQRAALKRLSESSFSGEKLSPHILVMSATPIPRTLSMTVFGDLDVSLIKQMPANRKPIMTKVIFESRINTCYNFIRKQVAAGFQAFVVYPLVEKSEKIELKSAVEHYEYLKETIFPDLRCGLLHGQMFWYEKDEVMNDFLNKKYDILVATTVIEVGIDIPSATVMMIENAERFGLSQLHQLRGRVGRGSDQSYCMLVTKDNFQYAFRNRNTEHDEKRAAVIRLKTMENTTDGFEISEVDMQLRGPGDVLGTRQSGLPDFKHINLIEDTEIIAAARNEAFALVSKDPQLRNEENEAIRKKYLQIMEHKSCFIDVA